MKKPTEKTVLRQRSLVHAGVRSGRQTTVAKVGVFCKSEFPILWILILKETVGQTPQKVVGLPPRRSLAREWTDGQLLVSVPDLHLPEAIVLTSIAWLHTWVSSVQRTARSLLAACNCGESVASVSTRQTQPSCQLQRRFSPGGYVSGVLGRISSDRHHLHYPDYSASLAKCAASDNHSLRMVTPQPKPS